MAKRNGSNDILNLIHNKTGKNVSAGDIKKLAGKVNANTMHDEAQLRKLIKQVGALVNINVTDQLTNDIVQTVRKSGISPDNLEQMIRMMASKK